MSVHVTMPARGPKIPTIAQVMKLPADLVRYEDGKLWYAIYWTESMDPPPKLHATSYSEAHVFEFPVPVDDPAAGGAFLPEMRAVTLVRWIRKHIEFLTEALAQSKQDDGG